MKNKIYFLKHSLSASHFCFTSMNALVLLRILLRHDLTVVRDSDDKHNVATCFLASKSVFDFVRGSSDGSPVMNSESLNVLM